jgi:hypothetical protein
VILKRRLYLVFLLLLSLFLFWISGSALLGIDNSLNAYINFDSTNLINSSAGSQYQINSDMKSAERGKLFIVFMDCVVLSDFYAADAPNLDLLINQAAIGLMTTNTGGRRSQLDAYVTMGAGTRVSASDKSALGLHIDETLQGVPAGDLYKQITSKVAQEGSIVNLGFAQTIRNNKNRPYTVSIGALGTALKQAGLRSAVIGNSDTSEKHKRYLVSFMMDDNGIVPAGEVRRIILIEDHARPFGVRTNYNKVINIIEELWDTVDIFAIELGDTSRAEDFRFEATDDMNKWYKRVAIEEADAFIGELIKRMDLSQDSLFIASALGSASDLTENNRLTPVIAMGPGYSKGLLTSASTKRPGILTNLDISATILSHYGLGRQGGQLGNRFYSSGEKMEAARLLEYNGILKEVNNQRAPLLRSYVTVLIILLLAALACIFFLRKYLPFAEVFLQFIMAMPVSYLLLPLFHHSSLAVTLSLSWLLALGITGFIWVLTKERGVLAKGGTYCLIISVLILVDQLTGATLIAFSPLGYDIISGARFYGLGNEYMGVLLGASCTSAGVISQYSMQNGKPVSIWLLLPFLALILLVLSHPGIGANVGGTISALMAFSSLVILKWKNQIRIRHLASIGATTSIFLLVLFMFDSSRAVDSQSHMGQTVSLIRENGLFELVLIAKRKIEMNIKLFRYTIWTRVFLLSIFSMAMLLFRPVGIFAVINRKLPDFVKGIAAGMIGCLSALIVNDSGIVAAGTSMIYLAPPVLLAVMEYLPDRENKLPWRKAAT